MTDKRTTEETTKSPLDGTELVRLATTGANWKATVSSFPFSIGTTPLLSGTDKHVLYDNAGLIGEAANFTIESGSPNITVGSAYLCTNLNGLQTAFFTVIDIGNLGNPDNWFIAGAGNQTVTGYGNTCMGTVTGISLTSGNNNILIGAITGINITQGSDNIVMGGLQALTYLTGGTITTGSQNIVIGSGCDVPSATANGQLSIGNFIYGTGLTGTGTTISTARIGIGVTAPASEFDVIGRICVDSITAMDRIPNGSGDNWFLGGAGNLTTTGYNNFGEGPSCLLGLTSGYNNLGMGALALQACTTGFDNVAMGYAALSCAQGAGATLTGSSNTALGSSALSHCTTGSNNSAIGNGALQNSTTAENNTAIGQNALKNVVTGQRNVALGTTSLSNTTGDDNVAIGFQACNNGDPSFANVAIGSNAQSNMQGQQNVAIGYGSMIGSGTPANNTGAYNVAIGVNTLGSTSFTTGSTNTAIGGNNCAYDVTTGQNNVFIGAATGRGITTGSQNTILGANVGSLSSSLADNIILATGGGTAADIRAQFDGTAWLTAERFARTLKSGLTIATGAITVTGSYHTVDTEAAAASDDLDTINGGVDGLVIRLRAVNSARTVVVKDGTGNIQCAGDFSLDNAQDTISLMYDGALTSWLEISRSDNGA